MNDLDKHIRCKCRKYWGMKNHKKICKRCKSEVMARDIKELEHKKILKSRRRRASKKPLNIVGFEYKDRKDVW